jgi:GT2 family glycosyltransferase
LINFSVIIPNFNGARFLPDCLESLFKSIKNCPASKFEIILVDNGSTDDSSQIFINFFDKNRLKNVASRIISNRNNLGFAKAANIGINNSNYEWVTLLNNDLNIKYDWFSKISNSIINNNDPNIAVVFGTVLNYNGTKYESQGLKYYIEGKAENISNNKPFKQADLNFSKPYFVWGATAALIVCKKDIIKKVNGFDEDFFAYLEDVDLAIRLHLENYKTLYVPQAISCHLGGGTSNRMQNFRFKMVSRNWFFILLKNYSLKTLIIFFPKILKERLKNLSALLRTTKIYKLPLSLFVTYGGVLIAMPKMLKKRKTLKKLLQSTKS